MCEKIALNANKKTTFELNKQDVKDKKQPSKVSKDIIKD